MDRVTSFAASSPFLPDVLDGRVALITGGGSGIGFEIAVQLARHGARVVLMGRRENFLQEAAARITELGKEAAIFAGDVRKPEDCAAAVAVAVKTFGGLSLLVNGAAGMFPATLGQSMTPNGFKTVIDIDVLGTYNMCYASFSALREAGDRGADPMVLNITVNSKFREGRNWWTGHMETAKAAITTLSHTMALEWAEFGIRVNNVAPGFIADTPAVLKTGGTSTSLQHMQKKTPGSKVPLQRFGTRFEIAMAVIYLCVQEYVTGETAVVDGGEWLAGDPMLPREAVEQISRGSEKRSRDLKPGSKL